jgi:phosphoribosylanthranilate isomerase
VAKIKICGLFREADIEFANEAEPDFIGFVFAESRRRVSPGQAARLRSRLREGIIPVGVFVNAPAEEIAALYRDGLIAMAQLHGKEDAAYIRRLKTLSAAGGQSSIPVIKALRITGPIEAAALENPAADYLLLDSGSGSGQPFDWALLAHWGAAAGNKAGEQDAPDGGVAEDLAPGWRPSAQSLGSFVKDKTPRLMGAKAGAQGAPAPAREPVSVDREDGNTAPPPEKLSAPDGGVAEDLAPGRRPPAQSLGSFVEDKTPRLIGAKAGAQGAPATAREPVSVDREDGNTAPPPEKLSAPDGGVAEDLAPGRRPPAQSLGSFVEDKTPRLIGAKAGAQGAPATAREPVSVYREDGNTAPPPEKLSASDGGVAEDLAPGRRPPAKSLGSFVEDKTPRQPGAKAGAQGGASISSPPGKRHGKCPSPPSSSLLPSSLFSLSWFLAGGISLENIGRALSYRPFGIDVSSGAETGGVKDREKMIALVRRAREAVYG